MDEFDLPCTDPGTALTETTARVRPIKTGQVGAVSIGVCSGCGARAHPDDALTTLHTTSNIQPKSEL